jgi:hypothetical protein
MGLLLLILVTYWIMSAPRRRRQRVWRRWARSPDPQVAARAAYLPIPPQPLIPGWVGLIIGALVLAALWASSS